MAILTEEARTALTAGRLAHLTTLNADGSPHVSTVWIGLDGANPVGMANYLIVYGTGRLVEGGAPELLQRLAETYVGPGVKFPPFDNPPPGHVIHITPERVGGVGPWAN